MCWKQMAGKAEELSVDGNTIFDVCMCAFRG